MYEVARVKPAIPKLQALNGMDKKHIIANFCSAPRGYYD